MSSSLQSPGLQSYARPAPPGGLDGRYHVVRRVHPDASARRHCGVSARSTSRTSRITRRSTGVSAPAPRAGYLLPAVLPGLASLLEEHRRAATAVEPKVEPVSRRGAAEPTARR